MGSCAARNEKSTQIDRETRILERALSKQTKILLLGPGESGKSTIFKQMHIIQDNGGFTPEVLTTFRTDVYANCLSQMILLAQSAVTLRKDMECAELVKKFLTSGVNWTMDTGNTIKTIWEDKTIRQIYESRDTYKQLFTLNDTAKYFFDNIERISQKQYQPTLDDILRVRVKSTGIEEAEFVFDRTLFRVVDVGGQRAERRKWIHCFDGVTAVLFCASLTGYDMPLREDPRQNRMLEALNLFSEVSNQDTFRGTAIIFFLNKTDLFGEKVLISPIENFFEEYEAPEGKDWETHFKSGCNFIKNKFLATVDCERRKQDTIFVHFTCALDTVQVDIVIKAVRVWLLEGVLGEMGV